MSYGIASQYTVLVVAAAAVKVVAPNDEIVTVAGPPVRITVGVVVKPCAMLVVVVTVEAPRYGYENEAPLFIVNDEPLRNVTVLPAS